MQYLKYLVALIATVFIGLGCGDPEVYLVKDGESEFHLHYSTLPNLITMDNRILIHFCITSQQESFARDYLVIMKLWGKTVYCR